MKQCRSNSMRRIRVLASTLALACIIAGSAAAQSLGLLNQKEPLPGITTSAQPTAQELGELAAAGYKTIIDLRVTDEDRGMNEKVEVEKLGMTYVSLPIDGEDGVTFANAAALDELLSNAEGPVLLHCASGNRAGALLALRAKQRGADDDAALALGVAGGLTGLESTVEEKLAKGRD